MLKYLRIAVTALSLTACVLLMALWVRSYKSKDYLRATISRFVEINALSAVGRLAVVVASQPPRSNPGWRIQSQPMSTGQSQQLAHQTVKRYEVYFESGNPRMYGIALPHWFLIVLSGAFTTQPWIHWSKRFSLRTLLIATTLVAVALAIILATVAL